VRLKHVLPDGEIVKGMRFITVNRDKYKTDDAYRKRVHELLAFCDIDRARINAMAASGNWTRFGICTCHWPLGSFYRHKNGNIAIKDDARPLLASELVRNLRVHVNARALAHVNPMTALVENMAKEECARAAAEKLVVEQA
jgi:hypothetical protein